MKKYIPVSCALYDEFENAAVKKQECEIVYLEEDQEKSVKTRISTFKSFERQEFMILEDGTNVRLDRVVSFNGSPTKRINCY
jgi:Rho-binding antiterminator